MKFLRRFWHGFIALTLIASLVGPSIATAQDTLDPNDDNIKEFLASLNIQLQPTDTLWQNKEFVEFVSSYQNIRTEVRSMQESIIAIAYEVLDLFEAGATILDPRIREALDIDEDISDEELQAGLMELANLRKMIDENAEEFLNEDLLMGDMTNLDDLFDLIDLFGVLDENDYYDDYYTDGFYLYAWQDPYDIVEAGNIVTIMSEIDGNFTKDDLEITWTQLNGPDVTWLNTDSKYTSAFIVPEYDILGDDTYLEFEVHAKAGDQEDWAYVYVDLVMG
jgi:hypothetical protein